MNGYLERFQIVGLHGQKNLDVVIDDNALIIVGENGSGKTTFLRILFHFLSGRWLSLAQFQFNKIVATISGVNYTITYEELVRAVKIVDRRFLVDFPPSIRRRIMELIERGDIDRAAIELERMGVRFSSSTRDLLRNLELFEESSRGPNKDWQDKIKAVHAAINSQVLYLPTYRRIERELNSIFEGVDTDDFRRSRAKARQNDFDGVHIELVEFGMKDVQSAIDKTLDQLKEFARESLNSLTLRYLGDVVNREYQNVGMKEISDVSEETVRAVLGRIHESILTKAHKDHLFGVINSARSAVSPSEHEKIIYHYFLKLLGFQKALQEKERQISEFCELCSQYVEDKMFIYDSPSFSFDIVPTAYNRDKPIELGDLSSGEKQIVSLFSHLYLSGQKKFFVLIDEPELSLSVPWQRRFLSDIRGGEFCKGIVAVTHSPFIYDNELKPYAHSLGEFTSLYGG